eukprot:10299419-Alexandrium_andersonii.AAC.1
MARAQKRPPGATAAKAAASAEREDPSASKAATRQGPPCPQSGHCRAGSRCTVPGPPGPRRRSWSHA